MKGKQINAILSDYDGTLCPTTSVRGGGSYDVGTIPQGLEQILFHISDHIPVCIISSKDFEFLHNRARFAGIFSYVLGLETINHSNYSATTGIFLAWKHTGCPKSDSTASSLVFKKAKSLYFYNVYPRRNYTRAVESGQSVPLGLYIIAPTIHRNKLVSIRITVNFDTRKVELLLRGRKLQSSTEHIKKILPRNSTKVRSVKKNIISIESSSSSCHYQK